mmetsp:Transcript_45291/g.72829  ORF Transcript_45291/g.72829 Transcript_45291/m.72829 type:complete len:489 (+) Transcript_45291:102-1568(+)
MTSAPLDRFLPPNLNNRVSGGDEKGGDKRRPPYGSFASEPEHSGLERSASFGLPQTFTMGISYPRPLNRYGLMTNRRLQRLNLRAHDMEITYSAPQQFPGEGESVTRLSLGDRSDSAFQSLIELSKSTVFLPEGSCSVTSTIFNMANCLIGSGILGLPFGLAVGGWAGLLVMFIATIGTSYTGKIIGRCIEHLLIKFPNTGRDRYQDMAELCCENRLLGKFFKYIINVSIVLELWGGGCSRIILQGSNLHKIFPEHSEPFFMVLCTLLLIPSVFIDMEKLAILSMLGLTSSILLLSGILFAGFQRGIADDTQAIRVEGLPITFGIILFSYSGHAVFPQIYRSMIDKHQYPKAVDGAFYISFTFYALMSAGGYLCWGSMTKDQITLNLPEGMWADTVILLTVINTLLSYPLIMTAPIEATEDFLGISELSNACLRDTGRVIVRVTLVLGTLAVALTISNFALIATFIGAVFTMGVSSFVQMISADEVDE